jgi:DNA polymerase-3 subunit gamma/tau
LTALYSTYRSQRFDDLVGQDAAVRTLKNALVSGRVAHAYLFSGIRGTGKTSTARILAKAVNCDNPVEGEPCNQCPSCVAITDSSATDLIEIDAASNRGIDEIRDLREKAKYLPALLKRKVYIIDEAHQLTPEAFNALLKTLEEPPGHVLFILCTTEAHKLPATIVSRCQRFDFRRITAENITTRLRYIAGKEDLAADDGALGLIARMAQGSMRDAITMLDQMASAGVETIDAESVRRQLGLVNAADIAALLAGAARGDTAFVLRDLDRLAQQGADMRQLTNSLADMARRAVLVSLGAADAAGLGIDDDASAGLTEIVASAGREFAAAAFEAAMLASSEMKQTHDPRLLLELLLLRLSAGAGAGAVAAAFPAAAPVAAPPEPAPATAAGVGAGAGTGAGGESRGSGGVSADPAAPIDPVEADEPPAAEPQPSPLPAVAAEVAVAAPADPLPSDAGLDAIKERWPALLEALKGTSPSTRVKALLVSSAAAPVGLDDDLLTIGFRWAVHSEKAQEPTNRQALEAAISQVYGRTYRLQFKVVAMTPPADAATPSPEGDNASGGASPTGSAGEASGQGLVQAAQEILGARVVDVRNRESAGG